MSVVSDYFKNRYVNRLVEFRLSVQDLCARSDKDGIDDDEYHAEFLRIFNQFISTTKMHIVGFEKQNVSISDSDSKYAEFMSQDWLISFLAQKQETSEILNA